MKKLLILLILSYNTLSFGAENLYENFANTILGNNDKYIVCIEGLYGSNKEDLQVLIPYIKNQRFDDYMKRNLPIYFTRANSFFPKETPHTIFLYKREQPPVLTEYITEPITRNGHYLIPSTKWLVILEKLYDEKGTFKIDNFKKAELEKLKEVNEFDFIDKDALYSVVLPELYTTICLKNLPPQYNFKFGNDVVQSNETLLEDLEFLLKISQQKPFSSLELEKAMPSLKTEAGKKIVEAMISIIEKEPVLLESAFGRK